MFPNIPNIEIVLTKMQMVRWTLWVYALARSVVNVTPFLTLFS